MQCSTDAALAERLVLETLLAVGWCEIDLAMQPKSHDVKVQIAQRLRSETPMSHQWIADRLRMGSGSNVSNLLRTLKSEL